MKKTSADTNTKMTETAGLSKNDYNAAMTEMLQQEISNMNDLNGVINCQHRNRSYQRKHFRTGKIIIKRNKNL